MSCQLTLAATFWDISSVRRFLFPLLRDQSRGIDEADGWDNADWGWRDEEDQQAVDAEENDVKSNSNSWLQESQISVSPTGEVIAIAKDEKLVLLSQKWDSAEEGENAYKYTTVFEDVIRQEENEKITSVLCLPLASQKRSTQGGPDWTCILVGFSSGWVRIYTEGGALLLSQIFSEEPVRKIKCRTYELPRYVADAEKHEEVAILYRKALVTIDGFSFFQSLRACRNQVARAAASGSEQIQAPPLAYKKWSLMEQDTVNDHITCGMVTPNAFDQMQTASILGGYTATIKPTPPASQAYITSGIAPYVAFYYVIEGSTQPMLSDVAHAVASKLKSAIFSQISAASGWFGIGGKQSNDSKAEKKRPKIEPATSLPNRFGIPDKRRHGESIVLSPDSKLAAVTDSFGRVMLVDIHRGVALRMWKGYRDAQIGWVEVKEDSASDTPAQQRRALFLIIYAPRRGILEVWTSQQGPRVAAFNVSKWCQLVCPGYGLMGLNNVTCRDVKIPIQNCYLLDPTGTVRTIDVPFHLALSDKNSKRARDMHLLKKLKVALKESPTETDVLQKEVIELLQDIKIASVRQQGLEKILHCKYLSADFLQAAITAVNTQLTEQALEAEAAEGGNLDYESRMLQQFCLVEEKLLSAYIAQEKLNKSLNVSPPRSANDEEIARCLGLNQEELQSLYKQMESYHCTEGGSRTVRFDVDPTMSPIDFISCFICQLQHKDRTEAVAEAASRLDKHPMELTVSMKQGLTDARRLKLGGFLFNRVLKEGKSEEFNEFLEQNSIPADDLLALVMHMWLSEDPRTLTSADNLYNIITAITKRKDPAEVSVNHNSLSPWWQLMRDMCMESENIVAAIIAAMVGRTVASEIPLTPTFIPDMNVAMTTSTVSTDSHDLSSWESVTMDRTQWSVLVKQLEDLLTLQCLLKLKPTNRFAATMAISQQEPISVSVRKVLDGGRGVIPELVAKWIAGQAIPPSMLSLADPGGDEANTSVEKGEEALEQKKLDSPNPIVEQLQAVQKRLPHSLDADVLMANCAWEYILIWNKDPEVVFFLQQAVAYLQCIQNAAVQHGVAAMMWQMFVVKKVSASAFLIEKVGKSPKERLCRRDVGVSDISLEKFFAVTVSLLDTLFQASQEPRVVPVLNSEDLWNAISGPTSLVELALEQKDSNAELVEHHYCLSIILHAVMTFSMRSVKPLSLYDTKGRNAFFKPIHSSPILPSRMVDDSITQARQQLLCKIITHAVLVLTDTHLPLSASTSASSTPASTPVMEKLPLSLAEGDRVPTPLQEKHLFPPSSPTGSSVSIFGRSHQYSQWPPLVLKLARNLNVDLDTVRRHHVCELYSSALDKLAEEVLLTVSDHSVMGSQLLLIVGQRIAYSIFTGDPAASVDKISNCQPTLSTWLKSLDTKQLRYPDVVLKDTAALVGQIVNQLPEGHPEYNTAISLVDLVQTLM